MTRTILAFATSFLFGASTWAADLLPLDVPIREAVDHYIDQKHAEENVQAAGPADDLTLARRLTLDLAGRIPTVHEARAYAASSASGKKEQLVERLMASPAFVRHQANLFDAMLMPENKGKLRGYLLTALKENRSWEQIFRELVLPDRNQAPEEAAEFLKARVDDLDKLTNEVSVLFFGVNVSCAKCHDHPFVGDWTQDRFFGMKSFFNRTFENGGFIAEREYGLVSFKTTLGESKDARLMFLTGTTLTEPEAPAPSNEEKKEEKKKLDKWKKEKVAPPAPSFSRRAQLVDVALRDGESEFFSKALVNHVWHRMFGYGLVTPLDQMHAENPPSHPQLLDWLARDFASHNYDLRRLIRGLALSDTYALSSDTGAEAVDPWQFAAGRVRPLSPQQYATSLRIASTDPQQFSADVSPDDVGRRLERVENSARSMAGKIDDLGSGEQIGVNEALYFSNSEQVARDLLRDSGDSLAARLAAIEDDEELIETAVWTVFTRPPDEEEAKLLTEYLHRRDGRRRQACDQIVWALLTSAQMRFNY